MSVVKDFVNLRKYNIHEVNKKIFQSQKLDDNQANENAKDTDQPISTSDGNNADGTTLDNTSLENPGTSDSHVIDVVISR